METVSLIDLNGNIRPVYKRYAIQRVMQKRAKWVNGGTAVQLIAPCPIMKAFPAKGTRLSVAEAMRTLTALFPGDTYAGSRASGALGGAARSGFITLVGGCWVRTR